MFKSMGEPRFFLGRKVCYLQEHRLISLSQRSYISDLSKRFNLPEQERSVTPIKTDYYFRLQNSTDDSILEDIPYKELVGSLIYVMVDIVFDYLFFSSETSALGHGHSMLGLFESY